MAERDIVLTGCERTFDKDEIIVSKTDPKGRIIYVNEVFLDIAGYTEAEILGKSHNVIRHPHMPRCIFKLLWQTISAGRECFAYVLNRAKNGDHYWVLAHITPTFLPGGNAIGSYHSNRRSPRPGTVGKIAALYQDLRHVELAHTDPKAGMAAAGAALDQRLKDLGVPYDQFVFAL